MGKHGKTLALLDLAREVLRDRLVHEVEARLDLDALAAVKDQEREDRAQLARVLA